MPPIRLTVLITAAACLVACGGKVRYANYYLLNVPAAAPAPVQTKPVLGSVAVRQFAAPAFLRAGPIVYRSSTEELDFYHYHCWADDPRSAVTNAVAQAMRARGVFDSVHLFDGRDDAKYLLTGRLTHLEEVDKSREVFVEVGLSAQLLDVKTGALLWSDASSKVTRVETHTIAGLVAGMSQTMDEVIETLVSSMQNRLAPSAESAGSQRQGEQ